METKRFIKKALSVLLAVAMVLSVNMPGSVAKASGVASDVRTIYTVPADLTGKTVILHTNDIHGAISKYAYVASVKENFQKRGATVILVDVGDFSQGTPYVSTTKGLDAVTMMNAAGYDLITLGNHEFDYGYAQLKQNLSIAKFKTICANILDANGNPAFEPNTIWTVPGGVKIGFFGLDTPETQTKVNPALIKGIKILSNDELYKCGQAQIDALKAQGADLVICLSHLGVDAESALEGHRSYDLYAKTKGIDLILDGHSHTIMTAGEKNEPVQSTGTKLQTLGVVVIDNASKKIEDRFLLSETGLQQEVRTAANANLIFTRINNEYGEVLATTEVRLNGDKAPGNRTKETNLGDLITDGLKWSVTKEAGALTVDTDHVVAITNGGGIRASIDAGVVTKKDINTVLPFGNTVAVVYVTGAELLEALEASTFCTPDAVGGYPQTSGIKFTIDTKKAFAKGAQYPSSTYHKPASINRVTIESINDKPFSLTDTYAVVTNNFTAAGGDTYYAFVSASNQFDTGIPMDEAVMAYVKEVLGGKVTADKYGQPRGDQTQK